MHPRTHGVVRNLEFKSDEWRVRSGAQEESFHQGSMGAGSSLIGDLDLESHLCSTRCDEMVDEACCQSHAKKGGNLRRRAEGLIVVDPGLSSTESGLEGVSGDREQYRARPTVHVQAFRHRRQSLLRPYGRQLASEKGYPDELGHPPRPPPRNRFSPMLTSMSAKVSTVATQTQTPSYPAKAAVTTPKSAPSPLASSHHDQTPNSLERNAISGRTR